MQPSVVIADTCRRMLAERLPNLFRLYLNPYVAQTCWCLERYVQRTWHVDTRNTERHQTFLANSFDEALSGAIKLARYAACVGGRSSSGWALDATNRLGPFVASLSRGERVEFLPDLRTVEPGHLPLDQPFGIIVSTSLKEALPNALLRAARAQDALLIQCVDRAGLYELRAGLTQGRESGQAPDIVVFDESFVNHDVPFGAFTARRSLFEHWNKPARSTFHSTTFQPNTISTLHFMRCLEQADPTLHAEVSADLRRICTDLGFRQSVFQSLYSPSLARAIRLTGFDTPDVRAAGAFVWANGRQVLDAVAGVACSVRGHNPPSFVDEVLALDAAETELASRLQRLTGMEHLLPAVSGASAVENALKAALVAQHPRRHVLALKSGFGGKTLLALTGTWNEAYKENLDPLYPHVSFIDPFAPDALTQIDALFEKTPVAVVQMELVQGVGGVRRVPEAVVRHLDAGRAKHGYLLLVDEVQTGMYRTGPFTQSETLGIKPDLLIVGKAISDMMFPFALSLYSQHVHRLLEEAGSTLPAEIRARHRYPFGYKVALNALRFAERARLSERVAAASSFFTDLLREELASCKAVRDVRVFGLLIGIELDASDWPQCWFRKRLYQFYLSAMLRHPRFPVLVGFCQCEPNVLKITPPLTIGDIEIRQMCATIGETLRRPFYQVLSSAVGTVLNPFRTRSTKHGRANVDAAPQSQAHAPLVR